MGRRWPAAALALAGLVGGCGQATLTTAPLGHVRRSVDAPAAQAPSRQTSTGNRHAAQREASRLLSLANVPPEAVAATSHPESLDQPAMGGPAASSFVDRRQFWRVATGLDATLAWLRAHPPRGLRPEGSSSGGGPAYQGAPAFRTAGLGYAEPDRPGMQELMLVVGVATLPGGGSAIRADGMAIWLDPRPVRDSRPGERMRVMVGVGCPTHDTGDVGVRLAAGDDRQDLDSRLLPAPAPTAVLICDYSGTNGHRIHHLIRARRLDASAAHTVAKAVGRLPMGHAIDEVVHCPMADGTATVLAFSYPGRPDVDLWLDRNGCAYVSNSRIMTAAGDLGAVVTDAARADG